MSVKISELQAMHRFFEAKEEALRFLCTALPSRAQIQQLLEDPKPAMPDNSMDLEGFKQGLSTGLGIIRDFISDDVEFRKMERTLVHAARLAEGWTTALEFAIENSADRTIIEEEVRDRLEAFRKAEESPTRSPLSRGTSVREFQDAYVDALKQLLDILTENKT